MLCTYRVVQLNFTPEIEIFYTLFEIHVSLSIFVMTSLKQHRRMLPFTLLVVTSSWTSMYTAYTTTTSRPREISAHLAFP